MCQSPSLSVRWIFKSAGGFRQLARDYSSPLFFVQHLYYHQGRIIFCYHCNGRPNGLFPFIVNQPIQIHVVERMLQVKFALYKRLISEPVLIRRIAAPSGVTNGSLQKNISHGKDREVFSWMSKVVSQARATFSTNELYRV